MAGYLYIKSFLWLTALGGLGYALLELTRPSEAKLAKIKAFSTSSRLTEEEKRKILFMQRLKDAASIDSKPVHVNKVEKQE